MRSRMNKKAMSTSTAVVLVVLIVMGGYVAMQQGWIPSNIGSNPSQTSVTVTSTVPTGGGQNPSGYVIQFVVKDAFNGTDLAGALTFVDVIGQNAGTTTWDLSKPAEQVPYLAAGTTSTTAYLPGTPILLHVTDQTVSGAGDEYFDGWFYCVLNNNEKCYELRPPDSYGGSSAYGSTTALSVNGVSTYMVPLGGYVKVGEAITAGHAWTLPSLPLYQRAGTTALTIRLVNPDGSSSGTWAGAANTYLGPGAQSLNFTAGSKTPAIQFFASVTTSRLAWGRPMIVLSSATPYDFTFLYPAMWLAINSSALRLGPSTAAGLKLVTTPVPGGGWTVLCLPLSAQNGIASAYYDGSSQHNAYVNMPLDTSSILAGTRLGVALYGGDLEYVPDAIAGIPDAAPIAYGATATSGVGCSDAQIPATSYAIAAAGINGGVNVPQNATVTYETFQTG